MSVIYAFASSNGSGLCAFAGDPDGSRLPERHGPWTRTGSVEEDQDLPHRLDRNVVEAAIDVPGFQMYRPRKG